jgi:hypothetical protein
LNKLDQDCCSNHNSPFVCVQNADEKGCFAPRDLLKYSKCEQKCLSEKEVCMMPQETIIELFLKDKKSIIYYGDINSFYQDVQVTDRNWFFSPLFAVRIEHFLHYFVSISFALGLINLLPISMLDGDQILNSVIGESHPKTKRLISNISLSILILNLISGVLPMLK